jgi:uncharacterized protein with FMN-binding domain
LIFLRRSIMNKKTRGFLLCAVCLSFLAALVACVVEYDPTKVEKSSGWTGAKDGKWTATVNDQSAGDGPGTVTVELTILNEFITDAKVSGTAGLASGGFGDTAISIAPPLIVASNGAPFADALSGASATTRAINAAIKDALAKAGATAAQPVSADLDLTALVIAPAKGASPDTTFADQTEYTGTIAWFESDGTTAAPATFDASTVYKAILTLTAKTGFTFTGVAANAFTYTGQPVPTNAADSGTVTITFPSTVLTGTTYAGEGAGYHNRNGSGVDIKLDVTFSGNTVAGYTITSHNESSGVDGLGGVANRPAVAAVWPILWTVFQGKTVPINPSTVVSSNNYPANTAAAALDAVAGATCSWTGFARAIDDAWSKALASATLYNKTENDTSDIPNLGDGDGPGWVKVEIAVLNNVIISVTVTGGAGLATPGIGEDVINAAAAKIMASVPPGDPINVVSGATVTSNAINRALADVKSQAGL